MFDAISLVGLGYIGLPTATLFASKKKHVVGIDINQHVVETVNKGKVHIVEPYLDMLVQAAVTSGYLRASMSPEPADAFLIAVPTPFTNGKKPDLGAVQSAAAAIAPVLRKGNLVVLESTSPVGTTEQLSGRLAEARPDLNFPQDAGEDADIQVAYCPERVLPGRVLQELVENDRIIGGMTMAANDMAKALYNIFVRGKLIVADVRTAEMCKLVENSFRDVNIAFANELSMICDTCGIDVRELIHLANRHPRVNILQPGPGVGGHCLAVDPWFIVHQAPDEAKLIRTAREVNDGKVDWVLDKVEQAVARAVDRGTPSENVRIACLGLTYKPNIDDLRQSPACSIVESLAKKYRGCVAVVEPHIAEMPHTLADQNVVSMELKEALAWATVVVGLVAHGQFDSIDFEGFDEAHIVDAAGIRKCGA